MYVVYDDRNYIVCMWACEVDAQYYARVFGGHYVFRPDIHAA